MCPLHLSHTLNQLQWCESNLHYVTQEIYRQKELLRKWRSGADIPGTFAEVERELEAALGSGGGEEEANKKEDNGEKEEEPWRRGGRRKVQQGLGGLFVGVLVIVVLGGIVIFTTMLMVCALCMKGAGGPSFTSCNHCRECGQAVWRTLDRLLPLRRLRDSPQMAFSRLLKTMKEDPVTGPEHFEMDDLQICPTPTNQPTQSQASSSTNVSGENANIGGDGEREPLIGVVIDDDNDPPPGAPLASSTPISTPPPPPSASSPPPPPLIHAEQDGEEEIEGLEGEEGGGGEEGEEEELLLLASTNATENE